MLSQTQKSFWSALKCAPVFIAAAFLAGCGKEEIQTYQIPKEKPATVMASAESNAAPLRWTVPQGWQEKPATGVRAGYLIVPGANGTQAEVTIIPFPGMVGTELDNVNRWRREINLEPITEKDISSQKVQVGSDEGNLYDISGAQNQTLATVLEKEGTSWFFKMRGDKATVSQSKETFLEFLKSIQFQAAPSVAETKPVARPINTNSKRVPAAAPPPENFTVEKSAESKSTEPSWEIPSTWREQPASAMLLKSFFATGDGGKKATITISVFPGDVGGALANVNRWRGQLGLEPLKDEMELAHLNPIIDVLGGKATRVDFTGTDKKTGKPARMIAIMVPRESQTWFYKLMGDDDIVAREKENFLKFVQTVRY